MSYFILPSRLFTIRFVQVRVRLTTFDQKLNSLYEILNFVCDLSRYLQDTFKLYLR